MMQLESITMAAPRELELRLICKRMITSRIATNHADNLAVTTHV